MTGVEVLIVAEKLLPALTKIGKNIGKKIFFWKMQRLWPAASDAFHLKGQVIIYNILCF